MAEPHAHRPGGQRIELNGGCHNDLEIQVDVCPGFPEEFRFDTAGVVG